MKILHIMASCALGGAETYSTDVMLSLHQAGVDQAVVMSGKAPRFTELKKAGLSLFPEVLAVPFAFWQRRRVQRLVEQEQPDVIVCWMRRAGSLVVLSETMAKKPKIVGWFGGYYNPAKFTQCVDFVGVTRDIAAHMVKSGVPAEHAHFIPTFPDITDAPALDRATLKTPPDAKVLLVLSRLHPKKGLDTLLTALAKLPDCILWLAGEGPDRAKLEHLAERLGVMGRVRFLGWRTDRAALLRAADICVLPSRYEPFGTVILEAWAARVPFVACKSAGPAAHVTDGENGLLVEIDDAEGLASALQRVMDDAPLRARLVDKGYNSYISTYTREAVTRQWLDFFRRLCGVNQ